MGLLGCRRVRRGGLRVESNQGRNPVRWDKKKLEMALVLRGSPEGCCLGCSSLMG